MRPYALPTRLGTFWGAEGRVERVMARFGMRGRCLGGVLGRLGASWARLGRVLGASWGHFWCPKSVLEASWGPFFGPPPFLHFFEGPKSQKPCKNQGFLTLFGAALET